MQRGLSIHYLPADVQDIERHEAAMLIEQVLASDASVPLQSTLRLPAGTRKLEFHYASLSFRTPRFVRYRFRLEGVDRGWIERGNQRVAQYTNLGPGRYRFEVNASAPGLGIKAADGGVWNIAQ